MVNDILIGFEVGTGSPVKMKEHHGVVSGQTQMSGKTTTIKALISRSGRKAVVFLTKRGEIEFHGLNQVQPYFKEQTGWRYIKSLLEAQEQRRMVFNEPWIIKACEGVKTLRGVLENTERLMKAARRDFDKDQYLVLIEYMKVVVPAVESRPWARRLPLEKGINVMDLVDLPMQMQALVIQSTLNYIMEKMRGVIAVIPEAWKFMPKSGNPVKLAAENYIRQGASIGNYLLIDSQDLAGVDTAILKQCNNWLMGFQRELNEAKRVAETAGHRITVSMIQSLKRGHFVASLGVENPQLVYVWPEGVPMQMAIDVAMGLLSPEVVKDYLDKLRQQREENDDMVWKEKHDALQLELEKLQAELKSLKEQPQISLENQAEAMRFKEQNDRLETRVEELTSQLKSVTDDAAEMNGQLQQLEAEKRVLDVKVMEYSRLDGLREAIRGIVAEAVPADRPGPAQAAQAADIVLETQEPTVTVEKRRYTVNVTAESLEGRLLMLWINGDIGPDGGVIVHGDLRAALHKYNWATANPNITAAMDKLVQWGLMDVNMKGTVKRWVPRVTVSEAMDKGLLKVEAFQEAVKA